MDLEADDLEQAVRRTTVLPVDRASAWSRLADAAGLKSWLASEVDLEVRPGAKGTVRLQNGETRLVEVEEVEPTRRLSLVWCKPGGDPSLVELTLDDLEESTVLTVIEMPVLALRAVAATLERESHAPHGPAMLAVHA